MTRVRLALFSSVILAASDSQAAYELGIRMLRRQEKTVAAGGNGEQRPPVQDSRHQRSQARAFLSSTAVPVAHRWESSRT
jgi:hypothetical protein